MHTTRSCSAPSLPCHTVCRGRNGGDGCSQLYTQRGRPVIEGGMPSTLALGPAQPCCSFDGPRCIEGDCCILPGYRCNESWALVADPCSRAGGRLGRPRDKRGSHPHPRYYTMQEGAASQVNTTLSCSVRATSAAAYFGGTKRFHPESGPIDPPTPRSLHALAA